jgi:hypothetical protein
LVTDFEISSHPGLGTRVMICRWKCTPSSSVIASRCPSQAKPARRAALHTSKALSEQERELLGRDVVAILPKENASRDAAVQAVRSALVKAGVGPARQIGDRNHV